MIISPQILHINKAPSHLLPYRFFFLTSTLTTTPDFVLPQPSSLSQAWRTSTESVTPQHPGVTTNGTISPVYETIRVFQPKGLCLDNPETLETAPLRAIRRAFTKPDHFVVTTASHVDLLGFCYAEHYKTL